MELPVFRLILLVVLIRQFFVILAVRRMPRRLLRLILLSVMIFFLLSDLVELLSYMPAVSTSFAPLIQRLTLASNNRFKLGGNKMKNKDQPPKSKMDRIRFNEKDSRAPEEHLSSVDEQVRNSNVNKVESGIGSFRKRFVTGTDGTASIVQAPITDRDLTETERKELQELKMQWTKVLQEYCLPKLVCELHASLSEGNPLSEAEKGLLSLIKETSLGSAGEVVSKYHFAAHMGQLLSGVEGNGCHNFYPNCPISGTRVLQMVKNVRIK